MEFLANIGLGFSTALSVANVLYCFLGALLGTAIGVLPGLGPVATIAMLLPMTFGLEPVTALIMLAGIFYGAQYGSSTTAILINLPGEASSVVTALDGYRLARQGRAGTALAVAALGSFFAGTVAALIIALFVWRNDVVRLLPQTALFYKMVGLDVNLRGLAFKDLKITNETVDGKPVLVIEGMIVGQTRKPVELPRLRFSVRDAQGAEIYAWNAVLEQPVLNPGERAFFKSRLASPPPEGRNIDVRFFNKHDLTGGRA